MPVAVNTMLQQCSCSASSIACGYPRFGLDKNTRSPSTWQPLHTSLSTYARTLHCTTCSLIAALATSIIMRRRSTTMPARTSVSRPACHCLLHAHLRCALRHRLLAVQLLATVLLLLLLVLLLQCQPQLQQQLLSPGLS
jgi:hypothetical protein